MCDIIENTECDRDMIDERLLDQHFDSAYNLLSEKCISNSTYITSIVGNKSLKLVARLSDNTVEVFDANTIPLTSISSHKNEKPISEVVFSPVDQDLLYCATSDGFIYLWDFRTSKLVSEYKGLDESYFKALSCLDVSCNGRVLCAGTQLIEDDAYLIFWDQREPTPLGGYWKSHTDDITQVKFHNEKCEILASSSEDGLVNIFNVMEQTEDDALMFTLNIENSIDKMSWLDDKQISCITQSNELQIWNTKIGDPVVKFNREKICRGIKRTRADDCYLAGCYTSNNSMPILMAGSYGGLSNCLRSVTIKGKKLLPCTNFRENKQIVRSCWNCEEHNLFVTAGESGLIDIWKKAEN